LRVAKLSLVALFAEQGLQTLVIEPLREYNTLKKLYDVVGAALYVLNALNAL
jgi:hypothetical protein